MVIFFFLLKIEDALNGKFKAWKDKREIDNKV
jgi:hypothetical protein